MAVSIVSGLYADSKRIVVADQKTGAFIKVRAVFRPDFLQRVRNMRSMIGTNFVFCKGSLNMMIVSIYFKLKECKECPCYDFFIFLYCLLGMLPQIFMDIKDKLCVSHP